MRRKAKSVLRTIPNQYDDKESLVSRVRPAQAQIHSGLRNIDSAAFNTGTYQSHIKKIERIPQENKTISRATSMFDRNHPYESYNDYQNSTIQRNKAADKKPTGSYGVSPQPSSRQEMPDLTKPYKV